MEDSNKDLIERIQKGDHAAFEVLYRKYYKYLLLIARHIVRNKDDAEEIVSDVFVKLWNNRTDINITTSLKGYIVKAVHNTSLNYLEKNYNSLKLTEHISLTDFKLLAWDSDYPLGKLYEKDIQVILNHCIDQLPDGCRKVFLLSRNSDKTYNDIADDLGISVNTVKMQIKIALSRLREALKDYLQILILLKGF